LNLVSKIEETSSYEIVNPDKKWVKAMDKPLKLMKLAKYAPCQKIRNRLIVNEYIKLNIIVTVS
jgi:hypothetical protein